MINDHHAAAALDDLDFLSRQGIRLTLARSAEFDSVLGQVWNTNSAGIRI